MDPTFSMPRAPGFAEAIDRIPIAGPFKRFVVPGNIGRIYQGGGDLTKPAEFAEDLRRRLHVDYHVTPADLARIPTTGPVVVVSNHPFGILEGLILFEMLRRIRPDVKILANSLLAGIPEMRDGMILVDPFDGAGARNANRRGVRETLSFLAQGGLLIVFPAGEVSHLQLRERRIADPGWNENIARFIRHSKATVAPIFIAGANSLLFQLCGLIHSQLRTARLLHELCNKEAKTIEVRVGNPVDYQTLQALSSDAEVTRYLRFRTYLLENRGNRKPLIAFPNLIRTPRRAARQEPIAAPAPPELVEAEVAGLERLADGGDFDVYRARAHQIPNVLHEIGRLREITFRSVGEGTGAPSDLDRFDDHYQHIFLWDREKRTVAGAYRLGMTAEILPRFGLHGLYTSTLFHIDERFFHRIGNAMEMGRSFILPDYQKQYSPLLLLWKGIGAHIVENPEHPVLFGPVSISNDYHPVSRRLIVTYLQAQESFKSLAAMIRPRRKFRARMRGADNEAISLMLRNSEELSSITADIESDGKGIPVLLRQYLKLGGKLLGFNVDPIFSNALDGLILVDLRQTTPIALQRYLGRDGVKQFMEYHQQKAEKSDKQDTAQTV